MSQGIKIKDKDHYKLPCRNETPQGTFTPTVACYASLYYPIENIALLEEKYNDEITMAGLSLPRVYFTKNYELSPEELNLPGYKGIPIWKQIEILKDESNPLFHEVNKYKKITI